MAKYAKHEFEANSEKLNLNKLKKITYCSKAEMANCRLDL